MTGYNILHKIVSQGKAPYRGLVLDLVDYGEWFAIRAYVDNLNEFSENQQVALAEYIVSLVELARAAGLKCYIEKGERVSDGR